jgi:hypothetical protein
VYKYGWWDSGSSKVQVKGELDAHRGVDQSNFSNSIS